MLGRTSRIENMANRFTFNEDTPCFKSVLLVDDVYTTGATLIAATETLRAFGVQDIKCATFARVW
jgi:predicted amidophosphoribosyltransferase